MWKQRKLVLITLLAVMLATLDFASARANPSNRVTEFTLSNGLKLVVVPDHRAPVVTHMVYIRAGSADEPPGVSGVAHFLEHLMFKSTDKLANGEFSAIVSRLGGQHNAFTSYDYTAYFERISKDRLKDVMSMEADRLVNLRLSEKEVVTERAVIVEERRVRTENVPSSLLTEQMSAILYLNHPYRIPIIGWMHEMQKLSREDALAFYKRFYAPNNAIVVVTGDVEPGQVKALAEETYGKIAPNSHIGPRVRPQEPKQIAPRRVELRDPRAGNSSIRRYYVTPSLVTAKPGEAESLYLLMKIAGLGGTSRLYQKLVAEEKIASSAGGWYSGLALDSGSLGVYAVAADGVPLERVEAGIDAVLHDLRENGVTEAELERAKKQFLAEFVYESDSQEALARRYGSALALGMTVEQVNSWPASISKVTTAQVKEVAAKYFDIRWSATGTLIPAPSSPENVPAPAVPAKRS